MGHAILDRDSRQIKREVVGGNCGSCLDRYVEHFLDKRVAAIKFQLWTTDGRSLSILVADIPAKHSLLGLVEIFIVKRSIFTANEVSLDVTIAIIRRYGIYTLIIISTII